MGMGRKNVVASGERSIAVGGSVGFVSTGGEASIVGHTETVRRVRDDRPRVGVSLLVVKGSAVLLGRRLGSHGTGEWGTPGGHQELGEAYEETAIRELAEECGNDVLITQPRFLCVTNLTQYVESSGRHYTDVAFVSHWLGGEPVVMEPKKCAEWRWHGIWGPLPDPAFGVVPNMLEAYRTGRPYFA